MTSEEPVYRNEMVRRARSATAFAFSTSAVSRKNAMYLIHTIELFGDCSTSRSKSSAVSGTRFVSNSNRSLCGQTVVRFKSCSHRANSNTKSENYFHAENQLHTISMQNSFLLGLNRKWYDSYILWHRCLYRICWVWTHHHGFHFSGLTKFPDFSSLFKFHRFSLTGKCLPIFPDFLSFRVGTLIIKSKQMWVMSILGIHSRLSSANKKVNIYLQIRIVGFVNNFRVIHCFALALSVIKLYRFVSGFPLFGTDKIPWYFQVFLVNFQVFFSLFLKYDFQVVLNINMQNYWVSFEQKINHFNYTPN